MSTILRRAAVSLSACACLVACHRGTPYVPFLDDAGAKPKVGDGGVTVSPDGDAGVDAGKPIFQPVHAMIAPPATTKWSIEGLAFEAPPGSVIVAAMARDLDGDGARDIAAYVQPATGGGGELRFYRGDPSKPEVAPGKAVASSGAASAGDLAMPAPCVAKTHPGVMALVGPHTIALDLRPTCGDAAPAPRRFVLAAFAPTPSLRWSARIADPPPGWTFTVDVEALDRDGDGVDDPSFTFGLEGGGPPYEPGERVAARIRYWDRPAGLARDRTEPEVSLQYVAQGALARASKKQTAIGVAATVRRLRLLHAAVCTEAGSPWLDVGADHGLACGPSRALEEAGLAEIKASLTMGDVLHAIAAREDLAQSVAMKTKKTRDEIDRLVRAAAPAITASTKELKMLFPNTPTKGPAWGALAFESSGSLLVRTSTGVMRVDPVTLDDGEAEVATWPWEVSYASKDARLGAVFDACEAPYLSARVSGHDVPTGATLLPLPILPSLVPARCAGGVGASVSTVPVAWGASGLFAIVDGDAVIIPNDLVTPSGARATGTLPAPGAAVDGAFVNGAPRSPSGSLLVVPTRFGLLRRDDSKGPPNTTMITARELEGLYLSLHECAISNDGARVACVKDGKVVLMDASGPSTDKGDDASP